MTRFFTGNRLTCNILLALAVLASSTGWLRADGSIPACYVLSAGVDNYPNVGKLNGCLNDAHNTTAAFQSQQGHLFSKVHAQTLLDQQATRGNILQRFKNFAKQGTAGDVMVLFLSGHGG